MYLPRDLEATLKRVDYLQQAIAKDSEFARAYVELAKSYGALREISIWPATRAFQKQKEAATTALELDHNLGDAHKEMAESLWHLNWDWLGAERESSNAESLRGSLCGENEPIYDAAEVTEIWKTGNTVTSSNV